MIDPTLDSGNIDLGIVRKPEKITLDNGLFKKKLPGTSSDTTLALDIFGKTRNIRIIGTKKGSAATMKTFVQQMDAWANSDLMERKNYKSSLDITYAVRADLWEYSIYHNRVEYVLVMTEAGIY